MKKAFLFSVLCGVLSVPVVAEPLACPDLSSAVKVGVCPSEDELKYTYTGFCSDNVRIYKRDNEACLDYRDYRKMKNIVLWESGDGSFHAYVSCDLPEKQLKAAKPVAVSVAKQGGMTRVICGYGGELSFVHRTRAECKVVGTEECSGKSCAAACESSN